MNEQMTITEGLSELNLITKKLTHKRAVIHGMLVTAEHMKDPYLADGGTLEYVNRELQSINDLENRHIKIRSAINKANSENFISIGPDMKSIHDWLTWKREIYKTKLDFINLVIKTVRSQLDENTRAPKVYKDAEDKTQLVSLKVNVNYPVFLKYQEWMGEVIEKLDGQLSLKNATIVISL